MDGFGLTIGDHETFAGRDSAGSPTAWSDGAATGARACHISQAARAYVSQSAGGTQLFLIRTKVGVSQIHGIGCFAGEAVEGGMVVWHFHPVVDVYYSAAQILAMPHAFQIFLSRYASKDFGVDRYVLCTDNARFINHAEAPNMSHRANTILANRDIAAGEELTLNYKFVDDPSDGGNVLTEISLASGDWDDLDPRLKSVYPRPGS